MSDDVDRAQAREEQWRADALALRQRQRAGVACLPAALFCGEHLGAGLGCGEPIGAARLAAVPGAQRCVACQGRAERGAAGRAR